MAKAQSVAATTTSFVPIAVARSPQGPQRFPGSEGPSPRAFRPVGWEGPEEGWGSDGKETTTATAAAESVVAAAALVAAPAGSVAACRANALPGMVRLLLLCLWLKSSYAVLLMLLLLLFCPSNTKHDLYVCWYRIDHYSRCFSPAPNPKP